MLIVLLALVSYVYAKDDICYNCTETCEEYCHPETEMCIDSECVCRDGYKLFTKNWPKIEGRKLVQSNWCIPVCSEPCGNNGYCHAPDKCACYLGWTGDNCNIECNCADHSDCEGPHGLNNCLECLHHKTGSQCENCVPGFYRVGNSCLNCKDFCHGKSNKCEERNGKIDCLNCARQTAGDRCESCKHGYFLKTGACVKCECHGQSADNYCNPKTGTECACLNNTVTVCEDYKYCSSLQCSRCAPGFKGTPLKAGTLCYQSIKDSEDRCFTQNNELPCDAESFNQAVLYSDQMVAVVLDKLSSQSFTRTSKITVDVLSGEVDIYVHSVMEYFRFGTGEEAYKLYKHIPTLYLPEHKIGYAPLNYTLMDFHTWPDSNQRFFARARPLPLNVIDMLSEQFGARSPFLIRIGSATFGRYIINVPRFNFDTDEKRRLAKDEILVVVHGKASESRGLLFFEQFPSIELSMILFFTVLVSTLLMMLVGAALVWQIKRWFEIRAPNLVHMFDMDVPVYTRPIGKSPLVWQSNDEVDVAYQPAVLQPLKQKPGVAVATVFIRLPGGRAAPNQLAFGSALVNMKIPEDAPVNQMAKATTANNVVHPL